MMGNTQRHLSSFSMAFLLLLLLSIGLPYATPEGTAYSQSDAPAPDIQVTPTAIEVTLREGQSTTVPLTIANAGDEELTFSISEQSIASAVQSRQRPSWFAETLRRDGASPSNKVEPALLDALDVAPDGQATFLVYLKEQADLSPAYDIRDWKARGEFVYRTLRETAQRSQKEILAELQQQKSTGAITDYRPFFIVNAIAVAGGRRAVEALASHPDVAYLASDFKFQVPDSESGNQSTPQFTIHNSQFTIHNSVEWNIRQIRADRVWEEFGITGEGVVVASIDTGVDYTHPALVNQYRGTTTGSHDYNWYDLTGRYPDAPGDDNGHGTHVMGIMVGDDPSTSSGQAPSTSSGQAPSTSSGQAGTGNRTCLELPRQAQGRLCRRIGVAPGARWIAARGCASDGWCTASDLLAAAEWMLAPCPIGLAPGDASCDTGKRPHVISNSWEGTGGAPWFEQVIDAWHAAGIFPAFSAGTMGPDDGSIAWPGDHPASFATGTTNRADDICWFSGRGPSRLTPATKPEVVAPGCGGIRSAEPSGGYATRSGVWAVAHTAGVVALLRAANPSLTVEELETLLVSTAVDLGPAGPDYTYGYGRLDAFAAVAAANDPIPWLSLNPASGTVEPGSQTVISATLNTAGLSTGTQTIGLLITSNDPDDPTVTVPVSMTVTAAQPKIAHIRVSNLQDVSATVSWVTNMLATGQVYYGNDRAALTNVAHDDRGTGIQDDVHHVTISGLNPDTTYYFYVASGGAHDDYACPEPCRRDGRYYQFTTGAPLPAAGFDSVYGRVFKSDGVTPATDVLVYLRVLDNDGRGSPGRSGWLSGLTDGDGYWIAPKTGGAINLAAARTENGQSYFTYSESGDGVRIEIQGAADCEGLTLVDTADDSPAPDIILSCLNMITLEITPGWSTFVLPSCVRLPETFGLFNASDLLGAIQDANGDTPEICQLRPELGSWSCHLRGLPFGDFALDPCRPYFLRSNRHSLLRLVGGICIAPCQVITLSTGWNFVALPRTAGVITADSACEQIAAQGGAASEIDRWDAEAGDWAGHICGLPFGDFEMTPDEGYFIKSRADSLWRPVSDQ